MAAASSGCGARKAMRPPRRANLSQRLKRRHRLTGRVHVDARPARWERPKLVRPPGFIVPCRPVLAAKVPAGDGWLHELKHDGYRVIAFKDGERVRLWSRNGREWSAEFVAITKALRALPFRRVMLDGEAVSH